MAALGRLLLLIAALVLGGKAMAADLENTIYLDVPAGRVVIQMRPDLAPATCAQIKALARRGFYDGIVFHRVIDGFMAQTGDPTGTGTGGSGHPLKAEFSSEKFVRGTVAMARTSDPNSADSQFFIMFAPAPSLDGKYTNLEVPNNDQYAKDQSESGKRKQKINKEFIYSVLEDGGTHIRNKNRGTHKMYLQLLHSY